MFLSAEPIPVFLENFLGYLGEKKNKHLIFYNKKIKQNNHVVASSCMSVFRFPLLTPPCVHLSEKAQGSLCQC